MAGDGSDGKQSLRRRFTTSIKRVMSIGSDKSKASSVKAPSPKVASTPTPSAPAEASESAAKPPTVQRSAPKKPEERPPPTLSAAERAQALFKKHGLDIKASEWPMKPVPQGERVHKEIRMRVHRTCHKCDTTYGPDKTCRSCGHKRCKKCPRQPAKRTKDKGKEKVTAKGPVGYKKRKGDIAYGLTIPNRRGGPDLVYKKVRQRVHRKCHRCQADFAGEKVCSKCKHNRCKKCPREPFKNNKPPGYYDKYDPDDSEPEAPAYPLPPRRTYKRPRLRVRWTCSKCNTTFIEKTRICEGCGSNRDDTGIRQPEKKPRKKFQPTEEELEQLNKRLKETSLGDTGPSAK